MMISLLPKVVLTDIDGVWTDGGMYYDQTGNDLLAVIDLYRLEPLAVEHAVNIQDHIRHQC